MTCIVGVTYAGRVYLGGDSAGVDGRNALQVRADKKVFRNGAFVMGFTSSFRMGNLLRHALTPPRLYPGDDLTKFMVTDFCDAVRDCLKKGGYATKDKDAEAGGTFLVGYQGRLFEIEDDYQVAENVVGYHAVGSGDLAALGALYATELSNPEARIRTALLAAEQFSASVRGPFEIVSTDAPAMAAP